MILEINNQGVGNIEWFKEEAPPFQPNYVDWTIKPAPGATITIGWVSWCDSAARETIVSDVKVYFDEKSEIQKVSIKSDDIIQYDTNAVNYVEDEQPSVSTLSHQLPAMETRVWHPVSSFHTELRYIIIDLNDKYRWTRDQIADWLETLDLDLRFK